MPQRRAFPRLPARGLAIPLLLVVLHGCAKAAGESKYASTQDGSAGAEAAPRMPAPQSPSTADYEVVTSATAYDFQDDVVSGDLVRPDGELLSARGSAPAPVAPPQLAAVTPAEAPAAAAREVTDAVQAGPVLVYTA